MATLTVQKMTLSGLVNATYSIADAGLADDFPNTGQEFIHIKNGGGSPVTVTADDTLSQAPEGAEAFDADAAVTVPGAGEGFLGPFPVNRFSRSCVLAYDQVTSVTLAVINSRDA